MINNLPRKIQNVILLLSGVILVITATLRDGVDNDYSMYVDMYQLGSSKLVEPTFEWICSIVKWIFDNVVFLFFIYALIGITIKLSAIKRTSDLWLLSLLVYISHFYILHDMTQIRAAVASGFMLLTIRPIYERNWKQIILFSICAMLFHYSALIIITIWFLGSKKINKQWWLMLIPLSYAIYLLGIGFGNLISLIPIPSIQEKFEMYQALTEYGDSEWSDINVFLSRQLLRIFLAFILVYFSDLIYKKNKYIYLLTKTFILGIIATPLFADMPVAAYRISEFYLIVEILAIPCLVYIFKQEYIGKIIVGIYAFVFLYLSLFFMKLLG